MILILYKNYIVQRSRDTEKSKEQTPSAWGIREGPPKEAVVFGGGSGRMSKLLLGGKGGKLFKHRNTKQLVLLVPGKVRRSVHSDCKMSVMGGAHSGRWGWRARSGPLQAVHRDLRQIPDKMGPLHFIPECSIFSDQIPWFPLAKCFLLFPWTISHYPFFEHIVLMFLESNSSPMFLRIPWELLWQFGIILCCVCPFSCLSSLHCSGSRAFHGGRGHLSIGSFVPSRKAGVSRDWWLVYMVTGKKTCWLCIFFLPEAQPFLYQDFLVRELL